MTLLTPHQLRKVKERTAFPLPSTPLTYLINRFQPSPEIIVLFLAVFIGVSTGMGVVTFHYLIDLIHVLLFDNFMVQMGFFGAGNVVCVPILGGIIVGLMRWRTRDFGPGLSSLLNIFPSREIKYQLRPVTKMIAAAVSLASGASLGLVAPSVEIGTNFGVLLSDILQVSQERQRLLLGAGAAAGLAAGFNAPIAGVFFALEVVLGTTSFATSAVSVVLLAAVVASLIAQIGLGSQPAFTLPAYQVRSLWELPLYLGLGLGASFVALTYKQFINLAKDFFGGQCKGFEFLSQIPKPIQPMIAGTLIGFVALQYPQILGVGYGTVQEILQDQEFSVNLLIILMVLKMLMTALSSANGFVGGLFAPAMFLGASLGCAYAQLLALLVPAIGEYMAAAPAYAMVGMAAVLAGSVRAPLTSIIMLFELTRDYRIVLPVMAAVSLSVWLVERIKPTANSNSNLQQIGLSELKDEQLEIVQQIYVADAMHHYPKKMPRTLGVLEAAMEMIRDRIQTALIMDDNDQLVGILSLDDINRTLSVWENYQSYPPHLKVNLSSQTVMDICTTDILYAWQDELLSEALDRMTLRGLHLLPVVARDNPDCILGLLEKDKIALTCNLAATNQALQHYLPFMSTTDIVIGH